MTIPPSLPPSEKNKKRLSRHKRICLCGIRETTDSQLLYYLLAVQLHRLQKYLSPLSRQRNSTPPVTTTRSSRDSASNLYIVESTHKSQACELQLYVFCGLVLYCEPCMSSIRFKATLFNRASFSSRKAQN